MINHIIVYINGQEKSWTVDVDGVSKIFLDRENKDHVVILTGYGIVEIAGCPFMAVKDYKTNPDKP